jgi:hypothetical protein
MLTQNQLSNVDFANNLVLNGINSPDKTKMVYDLSNGYNLLEMLMEVKGKKSRQITGKDGIVQKPIMGTSRVIAEIASNATSGSNLRVNFVDTSYDLFRIGESVMDSAAGGFIGKVVAKGAGYVILEPHSSVGTWNTSLHFVAGNFAFNGWQSAGNYGSGGTTSLYETPQYVTDRTAIIRESVSIARRDMFQTYVEFAGDFWWSAQDQLAIQRFTRKKTWRRYFSQDGTINSAYEGLTNYTGGLKWAIQQPDRGGIYRPLTSQMTQADFERFINDIADRSSAQKVRHTLLVGRGALNRIQSFTTPFIQFTGKNNTFGGESVKGMDVYEYTINGVACDLILDPVLNDVNSFPQATTVSGVTYGTRMQHTIMAVDMMDYEAVGGGLLPAMEDIHFGNEQTIYGYEAGLIGNNSSTPSNVFQSGKIFATNDKDVVTLHIYEDSGHSNICNRMGWMEYVV